MQAISPLPLQECISKRVVQQIVDVPVPEILEERVEVESVSPDLWSCLIQTQWSLWKA